MKDSKEEKNLGWTKEFYAKQGQWSKCYKGPIEKIHRERAKAMERAIGPPPKNILDLGGGGGQFATCAASQGYHVVLVDLDSASILHAKSLAHSVVKGSMDVVKGDFYEVDLGLSFHGISYFDGFGIGLDRNQRELLRRINIWLKSEGRALLEIYSPWYWAQASGREMSWGSLRRKYGFDPYQCRMLDTWWREGEEEESVTQSLRCYSPADLELLLEGTGLVLDDALPIKDIEEGGKSLGSLTGSMSYLAIIKHREREHKIMIER